MKAGDDKLKHHTAIVLLNFGCKLLRHVAHSHQDVMHDSGVVGFHEGENELDDVFQVALE